jgi:hypothetical protein
LDGESAEEAFAKMLEINKGKEHTSSRFYSLHRGGLRKMGKKNAATYDETILDKKSEKKKSKVSDRFLQGKA